MKQFDKEYCNKYCKGEFTHKGVVIHKIEFPNLDSAHDPAIVIGYQPDNGFTFQDQVGQRVAENCSAKEKKQIFAALKAEVIQRVEARLEDEAGAGS